MATFNTVIKKRNATNTDWDNILPITTGDNVLLGSDGENLTQELEEIHSYSNGLNQRVEEEIQNRIKGDNALQVNIDGVKADIKESKKLLYLSGEFTAEVMYNYLRYTGYRILQGGTYVKNGVQESLVMCYGKDENTEGSTQLLVELNLSTGVITRQAELPIGHANDIALLNNKLYITTEGYTLVVVDYTTFTVSEVKSFTEKTISIAYNNDLNVWYILTNGTNSNYKINVFNTSFVQIDTKYVAVPSHDGAVACELDYKDGILYLLGYSPSNLTCVDTDTFEILKIYENPKNVLRHTLTESEFITHDEDGNFYIGWNSPDTEERNFFESLITKSNFTKQSSNEINKVYGHASSLVIIPVYVDNSVKNSSFMNGTIEHPYGELQQAINSLVVGSVGNNYVVYVSSGTYTYTRVLGVSNIYITRKTTDTVNPVVMGMTFLQSTVRMLNIDINGVTPLSNYPIRCETAFVSMVGCNTTLENFIDANFGGCVYVTGAITKKCKINQSKIEINKSAVPVGITKTNANGTVLGRNVLYTNATDIPASMILSDNPDYYSVIVAELNINNIQQCFVLHKTGTSQAVWSNVSADFSVVNFQIRFNVTGNTINTTNVYGNEVKYDTATPPAVQLKAFVPTTKAIRIYGIL